MTRIAGLQDFMPPYAKATISRIALALMGFIPLISGIQYIRTAMWLDRDFALRHANDSSREMEPSGSWLPYVISPPLCLIGAIFILAAILPTSLFSKILGPPKNTSLWQQMTPDENPISHGRFDWW